MTVNNFMTDKIDSVKKVISNLPVEFDSHQFIEKFSKEIEAEYIYLLKDVSEENQFQKVNMQVGRFLSNNNKELGIKSKGKTKSKNVFGNSTGCELWIKTNLTFNDIYKNFEKYKGEKFYLAQSSLSDTNLNEVVILYSRDEANQNLIVKSESDIKLIIESRFGITFELIVDDEVE